MRKRFTEMGRHIGAPVHYLHIGKTGGTAIKFALSQVSRRTLRYRFLSHGHEFKFPDLMDRQMYFFSLREPLSRFRSGFYSRLRKGQPRLYNEWSSSEKTAFLLFPHANDLAEALSSQDTSTRESARRAMESIRHVNDPLVGFFPDFTAVLRRPPVMIVRQKYLNQDLKMLLSRLRLERHFFNIAGPTEAHANDYRAAPPLSELAVRNLREHYARDIHLYSQLDALASQLRNH